MNVALHHAATERIMLGGIPRKVAILGGTMAASLVLGLHNLYVIPVIAVIYLIVTVLYRCDPYFIEILLAHIKEDDYLYP